ncbi:hypothetical protein, partial [Bifidobacterium simiiventris]|uniref:hypothetical protein n=1 Tax=Bifidobacterium simiiventris TaxID=2834434 RepID=UPI001C581D6D
YTYKIEDTGGTKVKLVFTDGPNKHTDNNGSTNGQSNGYWGSGDTLAVSEGQVIADVTPNCAIKQ